MPVNRAFHKVLDALLILTERKIRLPCEDQVPEKITDNLKIYPYFGSTLGAINGSLFLVRVKALEHSAWRDRHQELSMNVVFTCDFNMRIRHILPG